MKYVGMSTDWVLETEIVPQVRDYRKLISSVREERGREKKETTMSIIKHKLPDFEKF